MQWAVGAQIVGGTLRHGYCGFWDGAVVVKVAGTVVHETDRTVMQWLHIDAWQVVSDTRP